MPPKKETVEHTWECVACGQKGKAPSPKALADEVKRHAKKCSAKETDET